MKKVAITGHTSGIGQAILDALDLITAYSDDKSEVRGYSRSNGWNLAEGNGNLLLEEIVDFDPDIFFNNAWHPGVQNHLCKKLHAKWKDTNKVIVNTGSITGYVPPTILDEKNIYARDKRALSQYCILESFKYPYENSCRLINFSWGFVETGLISRDDVNSEALIDPFDVATMMIDLADRAFLKKDRWSQPEVIINSLYFSEEEQNKTFRAAARNVAKHLIKTKKLGKRGPRTYQFED